MSGPQWFDAGPPMRAIDYAEPPRYPQHVVDDLTDRAYVAGHAAGFRLARERAAEHLRAQLRKLPHGSPTMHEIADEIETLVPPAGVFIDRGPGHTAFVSSGSDVWPAPRVAWRCSGCGTVRDTPPRSTRCPYPVGHGFGAWCTWREVPR